MTASTTQLREYRLKPGTIDDFSAWMTGTMLPARRAGGFEIEFAYPIAPDRFVWAVTLPVDEAAFAEADEAWKTSDLRAAAFEGQPQRADEMTLTLVRNLA